ncbi:MAG: UDPGP type 1 family protein [Kiritimatiellae bacterium]|nr:UDPGP type 1 family protein [Kiritimatiellia bacterium]
MNCSQAKKFLDSCGQSHVLAFWKELGPAERKALLAQISRLDARDIATCRKALAAGAASVPDTSKGVAPRVAVLKGAKLKEAVAAGEKEIAAGRVAALLVAGGQGSRLGYNGPKGCYSIGPVTGAPLFFFHARKILARSIRYGARIPFYVMTSEANRAATEECFRDNGYFGLDPEDVFFFTQGMWPGMDRNGSLLLESKGKIFMSPDGHGGLLAALKRSGALADMKKRGIKSVFFFQVDNPLVEVADPAFIGYHVMNRSEYSLKLCAKRDPYEKVGMPMRFGEKYRMVEYTEMTKDQCERKSANGELYFLYGSPAIHVFDRAFLEREAAREMPVHLAFKKIAHIDAKGRAVKPSEPNGYKFEKFIFDILPNAKRVAFLAFDQKDEFSPVKNAEGNDSPATCRADMQARWRRILAGGGVTVEESVALEIDPAMILDSRDVVERGLLV